MTTQFDQNRPDLPLGVYSLSAINAKTDPLDRIKNLKTDIEYLLRELQTDFRTLPDGKEPGLGERVAYWGRSSGPVALRRAIAVRNDVDHATGRSAADDVAESESVLIRTLEEVLSDAEMDPKLGEIARQLRGGLPTPRGVMSSTWQVTSQRNQLGVTVSSNFWASGMRGEEGCIAVRFFDGNNYLPLPAFSGSALQLGESFVQKLGGYSGWRQQFFDFDQALRAPNQSDIGWRHLRYRLELWRRPNPQSSLICVSESGDTEIQVCVPGMRVSVEPIRNAIYDGQTGLMLNISGTAAGLRDRQYTVEALFYDDAGDTLVDYSVLPFRNVSIVRSFTAPDDVCAIKYSAFMPYDALPTCRTSPKYKCRVGIGTENRALWLSEFISF